MSDYDLDEAAERGGVGVDELRRFVHLGIIRRGANPRFMPADLRRVTLITGVVDSRVPLQGLAAVRREPLGRHHHHTN